MTDVDNFHLLNDYWGYETGTNILNFILKKLELFPQTLFVNRYHSDIFVGIIDITWQDPAWCGKRFPPITSRRSASSRSEYPHFHGRFRIGVFFFEFAEGYSF